jgi:gamma-D-glutamyl-L-lysine dipeptidyl-peptidase
VKGPRVPGVRVGGAAPAAGASRLIRARRRASTVLVTREAFADWRAEPRHEAALVSQSVLGEIVALVRARGDWMLVEAANGYRGWVRSWALEEFAGAEARRFAAGPRLRVHVPYAPILAAPRVGALRLAEAGFLARLPFLGQQGAFSCVLLPGRGPAWLPRRAAVPWLEGAPVASPARLLALGRRLLGTPYLWGGTSSRGYDCSGLVLRLFEWAGIAMPRDAHEQAALGYDLHDPALAGPGDLLFFAERGRAVSHVAISIGRGAILHASRSSVRIERLFAAPPGTRSRAQLPATPGQPDEGRAAGDVREDLRRTFRGGRRYPRDRSVRRAVVDRIA